MKISGALGFGVFLIVLATLMPPVLYELTKTMVVVLQSSGEAFVAAGAIAAHAGDLIR